MKLKVYVKVAFPNKPNNLLIDSYQNTSLILNNILILYYFLENYVSVGFLGSYNISQKIYIVYSRDNPWIFQSADFNDSSFQHPEMIPSEQKP